MDCLLQFSVARIDLDLNVQTSAPTWKSCLFQFFIPNFLICIQPEALHCTLQGCLRLQLHHQHIHTKAALCCSWPRPHSGSATSCPRSSLLHLALLPLQESTSKFFSVLPLKPIVTCLVSFLCSNYTVFIPWFDIYIEKCNYSIRKQEITGWWYLRRKKIFCKMCFG